MPSENRTEVTYLDAVSEGLRLEMDADPDVFLIGEDIGTYHGAFKVTKGFLDKYGPLRIVDTPLAEAGFTGLAAGAAIMGLRPVVEYQFADFITCAYDQIINVCAKHHFRTGNPVPVVFRAPYGGRFRAGPNHSQNVEAYFTHIAGLKVVAPSTPADACGLLRSAIRDNSPVLYLESRWLYRREKAPAPLATDPVPIGPARIARQGTDVTLISWGPAMTLALEAADAVAGEGISVEVIDARTLVPLDLETLTRSVNKTSRAIVVHEDSRRHGYGAEVAATLSELCFWRLDRPVERVAAKDTPVPASPPLEDAMLPQATDVVEAVRRVVRT
jgi:acetoin:2,6-dichlorophenolindophenol oxidoreductase subunit beta